jgi:methylated-DNA-[protein]-cysteine S-methyltransferase
MKRKKSRSTEPFFDILESPLGTLYLILAGGNLRAIEFMKPGGGMRRYAAPPAVKREIRTYFESGKEDFRLKFEIPGGTEFEKKVWLALREIPYGETRTYKWLAEQVGKPKASRAVGQALGKNPLPIVLPCHRIIESDGSLGGYSGGVDIKRRLLDMEYYMKLGKKGQGKGAGHE